jgi:periplasmic protein TonB
MFADSLLEPHFTGRAQRGWTTLTSFALQSMALAVLLALPLLYTEGLPKVHPVSVSAPLGPPPGPPPAVQQHASVRQPQSNLIHGIVVAPPTIPLGYTRMVDATPPQDAAPCDICVPGGTGSISSVNPIIGSVGVSVPVVPPPPPPTSRPPRRSIMMEGNLIYRVQPTYPPLARAARIQGTVLLRAIISRTGTIENLQRISGQPMLVGAAIDAVRQWRYRPYILNGDPVEVETQVTVKFSLSGG